MIRERKYILRYGAGAGIVAKELPAMTKLRSHTLMPEVRFS